MGSWEQVIPASVRCHLPEASCGLGYFGEKVSDMPLFLPAAETVRMQKGKFTGQKTGFGESSTESLAALTL